MLLARSHYGEPTDKPKLVIVHGLFGSGRNWGAIARRMAEDREVVTVDMRNHAGSDFAQSQTYPDMAGDLAETIAEIGGPVDLLGHSMGGKAAMWLALTQPQWINRLVVADIVPAAYHHSQVALIHAMRALDLEGVVSRSEADRRFSELLAAPTLRAFLLQSLDLKAEPPRWRLNLDVLEAEMGSLVGWPADMSATTPFTGPTRFVMGAQSEYHGAEHLPLIARLFPNSTLVTIDGAGHWLHAEQPRAFEAALKEFLS